MEYLTLQDIPHRHCDLLHSRRMTASQSSERSLGNMVAAVSDCHNSSPSLPSSPRPPGPAQLPNPSGGSLTLCPSCLPSTQTGSAIEQRAVPPAEQLIRLPSLTELEKLPVREPNGSLLSLGPRNSYPLPSLISSACHTARDDPFTASRHSQRASRAMSHSNSILTDQQNHHMRSSPPIQPGEQNHPGKLPSFSEVGEHPDSINDKF